MQTKHDASIKGKRGYVWVFTNIHEVVVLLFRESRGRIRSRHYLADFKGVLVSDFYAAYDSFRLPAAEVPDSSRAGS